LISSTLKKVSKAILSVKLKSVILVVICCLFAGCFNVGVALAQTSSKSVETKPEWVQESLELASYIEENNMVVSEQAKLDFQAKVDAAEGEHKLELMYFHVLEAAIYGYTDIMEVARPAYIAELERQGSKDHAALMDVMVAFSDFYRGVPSDVDPMERLTRIHQDTTLSIKTRARACIMEAYLYGFTNRPEMSLARYQEVKDLVIDMPKDDFFQSEMLEFEFFIHLIVGDYEKMVPPAREKLELARHLGLLISGDSFSHHLARIIMENGQTSAIYEIDAANQRIAALSGSDVSIYHASFLCGRNFLSTQDNARALKCLQTAKIYSDAVPERANLLDFFLATAHARTGDAKTARAIFDKVERHENFATDPSLQNQFPLGKAELLHAEGDYAQAFSLQRQSYTDLKVQKSKELSLVVKQMREYSEKQFAAQKERELLLQANSDLKDHVISDQKMIAITGVIIAVFTSFFLGIQLLLAKKLKLSRREAEVANRAKSEFLANMSHEIRTPMNGVLGMTEALMHSGLTEKQRSYAETVYQSGSSLMVILNDILDFSKIEAGKMELYSLPFNLNSTVDDIAKLVTVSASEKPLEVIVRYAPNLPKNLIGDEGRIRQILMNLISNAVKFTEEGYVLIDVSGDVVGEAANLKIAIKDTGIGVSEEHVKRIFDGFTQAEGSTTRRFGGTGLGLTISRQLVEVMGGNIGVDSVLGEGAAFWIELQLPLGESEADQSARIEGRQILIIDDLPTNLDVLSEYVRSQGGVPTASSDPTQALKLLSDAYAEGRPFDLAIIDYKMSKANGAAVAKLIYEDSAMGHVPTVLMSTDDINAYKDRLVNIGVIDICMKPVRQDRLHQIFATAFSDKTAELPQAKETTKTVKDNLTPSLRVHNRPNPEPVNFISPVTILPPSKSLPSAHPSDKISVLVVDDNATNRFVLSNFLATDDYAVEEANDGSQAVNMACAQRYDIILMDISMPILDGEKATQIIRESEESLNQQTPIVACTAHAIAGDKERFLALGMNGYLSKPARQSKVLEMVAELVVPPKASRVA
jgi:signal transduction histidine kinase/PleD family two-component response regulator